MHIPFIKKLLPEAKLVPLMVGHVPEHSYPIYGKILARYFNDPSTLFIISTDFCHWGTRFKFTHRFPDTTTISSSINKLDHLGISLIE